MSKLKLISVLQSRIAKRGMLLKTGWNSFADKDYKHDRLFLKFRMIKLGLEQKEDKQILKQLVMDARHKQHYVEVVYVMNKELQVLRRELASYKITGLPYALHHLRGTDESKRRVY